MLKSGIFDALYGRVTFDNEIIALASAPLVQRLRHVRLSNIDSIASPGIANISRFEHAIGVATLAGKLAFFPMLSKYDRLLLQSSALLHDWAITAFGHLVEEAYAYAGAKFEHEGKLSELAMGDNSEEVGGVDRQILGGRETGLHKWAISSVGAKSADKLIYDITQTILGKGHFGPTIAGTMDIDNIDNVYRVAYHLGLRFDIEIPEQLVKRISNIDAGTGTPLFSKDSVEYILAWLEMRERVYDHLMLAEQDFTAKLMLICAVVAAYRANEISNTEWNLTDHELIARLRDSKNRDCKETVERWLVGEYWDSSSLIWMKGRRPTFVQLNEFNDVLSGELKRRVFAYCIKDKRKRKLKISFDDGACAEYGSDSTQWLLGVASPQRRSFTVAEDAHFVVVAERFFGTDCIAKANVAHASDEDKGGQICLI